MGKHHYAEVILVGTVGAKRIYPLWSSNAFPAQVYEFTLQIIVGHIGIFSPSIREVGEEKETQQPWVPSRYNPLEASHGLSCCLSTTLCSWGHYSHLMDEEAETRDWGKGECNSLRHTLQIQNHEEKFISFPLCFHLQLSMCFRGEKIILWNCLHIN